MNYKKNAIRRGFNKAATTYDKVAGIQRACADYLIALLTDQYPSFYPKKILDLGTGTGYTSRKLFAHFPNAKYALNDISENMLDQAKQQFPNAKNMDFHLGDMEKFCISPQDLIISNLAFQWAGNLYELIKNCQCKTKILAFSCLTQGTFQEWGTLLGQHDIPSTLHRYPTPTDLFDFCTTLENGHFFTKCFGLDFQNPRDFIRYLQSLGAITPASPAPFSTLRSFILEHQQAFSVSYEVFFGVIGLR